MAEQHGDAVPALQIYGHTSPITGLVLSRCVAEVYSCSRDGTVKTWDLLSGTEVSAKSLATPVNAMAIVREFLIVRTMRRSGFMRGVKTKLCMES